MNINYHNRFISWFLSRIQHYNHKKYWKRRKYVTQPNGFVLKKLVYLVYIKRCDAYNNASMGTDYGSGAVFEEPPLLPHGLNGIVVCPQAKLGKNVRIFHQVTIGNDYKDINNAPVIGNDVTIFPGAKIFGKISIGDNSIIGANAVVNFDVPAYSMVVCEKSRLIRKGINDVQT